MTIRWCGGIGPGKGKGREGVEAAEKTDGRGSFASFEVCQCGVDVNKDGDPERSRATRFMLFCW